MSSEHNQILHLCHAMVLLEQCQFHNLSFCKQAVALGCPVRRLIATTIVNRPSSCCMPTSQVHHVPASGHTFAFVQGAAQLHAPDYHQRLAMHDMLHCSKSQALPTEQPPQSKQVTLVVFVSSFNPVLVSSSAILDFFYLVLLFFLPPLFYLLFDLHLSVALLQVHTTSCAI